MTEPEPLVPKAVTDRLSEVIEDVLAHAPDEFTRYALGMGLLSVTAFRLTECVPDLPGVLRALANDLERTPGPPR